MIGQIHRPAASNAPASPRGLATAGAGWPTPGVLVDAVNHSDHSIVDDAHTNSCENRHSFVRQWLAPSSGVSKHHLQGYLDFLALLLNFITDWFSSLLTGESS